MEPKSNKTHRFSRKHLMRPIILLVVLGAFYASWSLSRPIDESGLYYGTLEGESLDVASAVSGQLLEIHAIEGQWLEANQVVAVIDNADAVLRAEKSALVAEASGEQASKANAPARAEEITIQENAIKQLQMQQKQLDTALSKAKTTLQQAKNTLSSATKTESIKAEALVNAKSLFAEGTASQNALDLATLDHLVAQTAVSNYKLQLDIIASEIRSLEHQRTASELSISSAKERLSLLNSGLDTHDKAVADLMAQASKKDDALAKLALSRFDVKNFSSGQVTSINYSPGEFVFAGAPILTMHYPDRLSLDLYIREESLSRVKVGQTIELSVLSSPQKRAKARVVTIAHQAMYTPMNVVTTKDRTRLVYKVELKVDEAEAKAAELVAGMMVEAQLFSVALEGQDGEGR